MNPRSLHLALLFAVGAGVVPFLRAAETAPTAVATYECLGLYWASADPGECAVQFRREGDGPWRAALPLAYDARDHEYRGSIVGLAPDTSYEIKLIAGGRASALRARTRSDRFPVGETTALPPGESVESFTIAKSGTLAGISARPIKAAIISSRRPPARARRSMRAIAAATSSSTPTT
jgi:hypothetical protein